MKTKRVMTLKKLHLQNSDVGRRAKSMDQKNIFLHQRKVQENKLPEYPNFTKKQVRGSAFISQQRNYTVLAEMASIRGFAVKNVSYFPGLLREIAAEGDLYLEEKKIASWAQSADMTLPDSFESSVVDEELLVKTLAENCKRADLSKDSLYMAAGMFMEDLLELNYLEGLFRTVMKIGYGGVYVVGKYAYAIPEEWPLEKVERIYKNPDEKTFLSQDISYYDEIGTECSEGVYFTDISQFNIGKPIKIDDLMAVEVLPSLNPGKIQALYRIFLYWRV